MFLFRLFLVMTPLQFPVREVPKVDYVAFSPEYLYQMTAMLRSGIGAIASVALYAFLVIFGLLIFLDFINHIGQ